MPVSPPVLSPTTNLVSDSRAQQNAQLAALAASNAAYYASLVAAASKAVQKACKRDFLLTSYVGDLYSGGIYTGDPILLRQYPVQSLDRVATPRPVLQVQNTDSATNQRATVATSATGITLYRVASASPTTATLLFSDAPTLAALATAINGMGAGWSATVQGSYGLYPSADLRQLQGAVTVLGTGRILEGWVDEIPEWATCWPVDGGWGQIGWDGSGVGWRLDPPKGKLFGRFPRGQLNLRIDATCGFASIPDDIQEATVQYAVHLSQTGAIDQTVTSERIGDYSVAYRAQLPPIPPQTLRLLAPYTAHDRLIHSD